MNRQFKFRAWHKQFKVMHDFILTDIVSDIYGTPCLYIEANGITELKPLIEFEIMQYLGEDCKDCDGVELCEDDLVINKFTDSPLLIKYSIGNFYAEEIRKHKNNNFLRGISVRELIGIPSTKIIGNIHQNPELLNGI